MLTTDRNFSLREISLYLASLSIHDLSISLCERSSSFSNELYKIKKTISIKVATYFDNHAQSINPQNGFNLNTIVVFMSTHNIKKDGLQKGDHTVTHKKSNCQCCGFSNNLQKVASSDFGSKLG